jgi:hypothetical protein
MIDPRDGRKIVKKLMNGLKTAAEPDTGLG